MQSIDNCSLDVSVSSSHWSFVGEQLGTSFASNYFSASDAIFLCFFSFSFLLTNFYLTLLRNLRAWITNILLIQNFILKSQYSFQWSGGGQVTSWLLRPLLKLYQQSRRIRQRPDCRQQWQRRLRPGESATNRQVNPVFPPTWYVVSSDKFKCVQALHKPSVSPDGEVLCDGHFLSLKKEMS